jgi:hypothetical protein
LRSSFLSALPSGGEDPLAVLGVRHLLWRGRNRKIGQSSPVQSRSYLPVWTCNSGLSQSLSHGSSHCYKQETRSGLGPQNPCQKREMVFYSCRIRAQTSCGSAQGKTQQPAQSSGPPREAAQSRDHREETGVWIPAQGHMHCSTANTGS